MILADGRIVGTVVGSTAPLSLAVLAVHVLAGLTAVASGLVAALADKGSARHVRAGRRYYRAITVVFATALVLTALRWRQDYYLALLGALAYAAAVRGVRHRRHHRPGHTGHITAMATSYATMLTAFYADNGPHLPLLDHLPAPMFWLLPGTIAALITLRAVRRHRSTNTRRTTQ